VIYSYNKSQQHALFLKFILVQNSIRFGQIYCPSSGVSTLSTQQLVFVMLVMLTVCSRGRDLEGLDKRITMKWTLHKMV